MDTKTKALYSLGVEVKVHCAALMCVNNIGEVCNLKGLGIDAAGACSGMITLKPKKKKDDTE
jgi:hypothetical protein